jgi:hypothetical protein
MVAREWCDVLAILSARTGSVAAHGMSQLHVQHEVTRRWCDTIVKVDGMCCMLVCRCSAEMVRNLRMVLWDS